MTTWVPVGLTHDGLGAVEAGFAQAARSEAGIAPTSDGMAPIGAGGGVCPMEYSTV